MKSPQLSKFIITPVNPKKQTRRIKGSLYKDFRKQANRQIIKACYSWIYHRLSFRVRLKLPKVRANSLIGSFSRYKVGWKDVIIALLLGLLLAPHTHALTEPTVNIAPHTIHKQKQLQQAPEQAQARLDPIPVPQPVYTPPTPVVTSCPIVSSSDYYVEQIIQHESGGNSCAVNPSSGACGAFQRLPCTVTLGDAAGQLANGIAYMNSRYGSSANAWAFWSANHWY